jgi:hypothetical protein
MWAFSLLIAKTKNVKNKVDLSQELINISKNLEKGGNERGVGLCVKLLGAGVNAIKKIDSYFRNLLISILHSY